VIGDPEEIARLNAKAMWAEDKASRALGVKIEKIGPGFAVLSMSVGINMVNGHGLCHGGYIFTLADCAFALACNSRHQRHAAQHCAITFLSPGRLGMRLLAEARERQRGERIGIYDVTVKTDAGAVIAEFRGRSRSIPGAPAPER
jgi:acyl-CoA thioesterase